MKKILDYVYLLGVAGFVIAVDQLTKAGSVQSGGWRGVGAFRLDGSIRPFPALEEYRCSLRYVSKRQHGFTIIAFVVIAAILYYNPLIPSDKWLFRLALGLQMGGAAGNLIDRLFHGPVTDFISIGNFAVFNLADSGISVGVAILVLAMWLDERKQTPEAEQGEPGHGDEHALSQQLES